VKLDFSYLQSWVLVCTLISLPLVASAQNSSERAGALAPSPLQGYNAEFAPRFDAALASLQQVTGDNPKNWQQERKALETARALIKEYLGRTVFADAAFRSPKFAELQAAIPAAIDRLNLAAGSAFKHFDHTGPDNFFAEYPSELPRNYLRDNSAVLVNVVNRLSETQIAEFRAKYGPWLDYPDLNSLIAASAGGADERAKAMEGVIAAFKGAGEAGIQGEGARVSCGKAILVDATSKNLVNAGMVEFAVRVDMDLPFESSRSSMDALLGAADTDDTRLIILWDVTASKVSRQLVGKTDFDSQFLAGKYAQPNPAYPQALSQVLEAQNNLVAARSMFIGPLNDLNISRAADALTQAQQNLLRTPRMILRDDMRPYKYSVSDITVAKTLTTNYYVINKASGRYFKGVFESTDEKSFKIAYNLHNADPSRRGILSGFSNEAEVASFEQLPVTLDASTLVDNYLKNQRQAKPLVSITALRDEMLANSSMALAAHKPTQYDAKPKADARLDSVVVVKTPSSQGSGFFVTPDLVMTNFHVIEGFQSVEIKMYNGQDTFGEVIKTDLRRDLALVKVQSRGMPVRFFEGNTLELGATVEAIGHPAGLDFSITRGVISALRKQPSLIARGGKDVLFIQTDAAINPGNSGGPLFLNNKVVGVNDKYLRGGNGGLSFAIHYSEAKAFLQENL
jgi:S1-C subfamily serine protease